MAVLEWGTSGQRFFEVGTDRGVLYPTTGDGVAWNGLMSVSESPTGGDPRPYYIDGFKYLNLATSEEFAATIEAFSAPSEFDICDGTASIHNGLFVTQQRRQQFGFSYRTKVGNDEEGLNLGYKIHLVYNALAGPVQRNNVTINDSAEPLTLSWDITTAPMEISGFKPSAHFIIDSRKTPKSVLSLIEDVIYGTSISAPRLPSVEELVYLFDSFMMLMPDMLEAGVWEIFNTDDEAKAATIMSPTPPSLPGDGSPILWLDTSIGGMQYATLKLITGD